MTTALSRVAALLALASAPVLLQGCAETKQAQPNSTLRIFAADQTGGAKTCQGAKPAVTDGQAVDAAIKLGNDGGWCAVSVDQRGRPFASALLTGRPNHGKVFVHQVGDATRIDYTPFRGFVGADSFAVKLIPGDGVVRVAVTVTGP